MSAQGLERETFTTPPERIARITRLVVRHANGARPLRVLDLGCGTGEQLLALAQALPHARLTGLDISRPSITRAREAARARGSGERVRFEVGDYMAHQGGAYDLILADTVLHAIPAPDEALFEKLAADLTPGGLLIYTMPTGCLYNRALALARRLFRALHGPATDALFLALARVVHGRRYSAEALKERIPYMYLVPARYDGPALHAKAARAAGLTLREHALIPQASVAQMKHACAVLAKQGITVIPTPECKT